MPHSDQNLFESKDFLLQIFREHFIYAIKPEVRFDFRKIAKVRIYRRKSD